MRLAGSSQAPGVGGEPTVSPVFRHGGLRLYLLKLLDEAPRHGYDVIRLLQDRFLGIYSPSPGTIYPRLARLEEEGLVTHEVIDGKKVYKITDAGREELHRRLDELSDIEESLAASIHDIAGQMTRDIRETVRSMREELTWALREASRGAARGQPRARGQSGARAPAGGAASSGQPAGSAPGQEQPAGSPPGSRAGGEHHDRPAGDAGEAAGWPGAHADWREWADWACRGDWRQWAGLAGRGDWRQWFGRDAGPGGERGPAHGREAREHGQQAKADWHRAADRAREDWREASRHARAHWSAAGHQGWRPPDTEFIADLERLAGAFAAQVRGVAAHADAVSEDAAASLAKILGDALNRIAREVFRVPEGQPERSGPQRNGEGPGA